MDKVLLEQFRLAVYSSVSKQLVEQGLIVHKSQIDVVCDPYAPVMFASTDLVSIIMNMTVWGEQRTKTETVFTTKPKNWLEWQKKKYVWLQRIFGPVQLEYVEFKIYWNVKRLFPVTGKNCYYMTEHSFKEI